MTMKTDIIILMCSPSLIFLWCCVVILLPPRTPFPFLLPSLFFSFFFLLIIICLFLSMDNSSQWPQGFGVVKAVDHIPSSSGSIDQQQQQKRTLTRPQKDQAVNCPRCNSVNTKFCYYNNYSLSQPRYFCKTCRRYWTAGGSLRNVPVGGGSRKNRRSSSVATSSSSVLTAAAQAQAQAVANNSSSVILHQGHDLNLSFPPHPTTHDHDLQRHHQQYPINPNLTFSTTKPANFSIDQLSNSKLLSHHHLPNTNNSSTNNMITPLLPPMGLFKNSLAAGNNESREMMSSFMNPSISSSASIFSSSGFPPNHQDQFKPSSLNFSLDGFSGGGGGGSDDGYASSLQLGVQQQNIIDHGSASSGGARLLFPFNQENVNKAEQVPNDAAAASSTHVDQFDHPHNRSSSSVQGGGGDGSISAGFWTGMLSGGSW